MVDKLFWLWPLLSIASAVCFALWQRHEMEAVKADIMKQLGARHNRMTERVGEVENVAQVAAERIAALQSTEMTGHVPRSELRAELGVIINAVLGLNKRLDTLVKDYGESHQATMKYVADVTDNISGQISEVDDKVDAAVKAASTESSLFRAAVTAIETETARVSAGLAVASKNATLAVDLLTSMNAELRATSARTVTIGTDLERFARDTSKAYADLEADLSEIVAAVQSHGDRLDGLDSAVASASSQAGEALSSAARTVTDLSTLAQRLDDTDATVDEIDDSLVSLEETTIPSLNEGIREISRRYNDIVGATLGDMASMSSRLDSVAGLPDAMEDLRRLVLSHSQQQAAETNRVATELGAAIDKISTGLSSALRARMRLSPRAMRASNMAAQ